MTSTTTLPHSDFAKCIRVEGQYVITGSRDEKINIWNSSVNIFLILCLSLFFLFDSFLTLNIFYSFFSLKDW